MLPGLNPNREERQKAEGQAISVIGTPERRLCDGFVNLLLPRRDEMGTVSASSVGCHSLEATALLLITLACRARRHLVKRGSDGTQRHARH